MGPINKFEAIGVFVSIAVMAVALAVIRFEFNPLGGEAAAIDQESQGAIVVVATDVEGSEAAALADALIDAATSSGELVRLVIDDIQLGEGPKVKKGDAVTVDYIGSTQAGVQFDSSYGRGETFTFTVGDGKVIEGWERGLIGMQVGGERILVIPAEMAYGNRKVGMIEANSTLVFAVVLHEID